MKGGKRKLASKRIILFASSDDPHKGKLDLQKHARQKSQDLKDNGVEIELLPIGSRDFNTIVTSAETDATEKLQQMQERVRKRAYKRRPNGHVELEIAPDLKISVEVYNLVRSLNKPTAVKLSKRTNEEVLAITNTFTKETGQLLMSDDVVKTQEYGGKKFAFSQAEAREIKSILKDPIIRIVGFTKLDTVVKQEPSEPDPADPDTVINKPLKHMKLQHHVAPASFIYPDEKNIKGSTKLFKALLSRCFVRGVAPIAWFMPRRNVNLRLVALVPETDDDDVGGNRLTPPGFHVVPLPYADDFRNAEISPECEIVPSNDEQIEAATALIEKLKTEYSDDLFKNPSLQKHWRNIEALALEKEEADEFIDTTLPDLKTIKKKAEKEIEAFKSVVFPVDYDGAKAIKKPAVVKRRFPSSEDEKPAAVRKVKKDASGIDMDEQVKNGTVEKLTVDILKSYLSSQGVKISGLKKADLVSKVYSLVE